MPGYFKAGPVALAEMPRQSFGATMKMGAVAVAEKVLRMVAVAGSPPAQDQLVDIVFHEEPRRTLVRSGACPDCGREFKNLNVHARAHKKK